MAESNKARLFYVLALAVFVVMFSAFLSHKKVVTIGSYQGFEIGEHKRVTLQKIIDRWQNTVSIGTQNIHETIKYDTVHRSAYRGYARIPEGIEVEEIPNLEDLLEHNYWRVTDTLTVTYYFGFSNDALTKITRINTFVELP